MTYRTPKPGDILRSDDGDSYVVEGPDVDVIDALLDFVEEGYGSPRYSRDNPAIIKAAESKPVRLWSCTKDYDAPDENWWASDGDGRRSLWVIDPGVSDYVLGELAAEHEPEDELVP